MRLGGLVGQSSEKTSYIVNSGLDWLALGELELFKKPLDVSPRSYIESHLDGVYEPEPYMRGYYKDAVEKAGSRECFVTRIYQSGGQLEFELPLLQKFFQDMGARGVVRLRDPEPLDAVPDDCEVGVTPGFGWDEHGFWALQGCDVWIIGGEPWQQWRTYLELEIVGANVTTVIVDLAHILILGRRDTFIGGNPYRRVHPKEDMSGSELGIRSLKNLDEFWRLVN